jgi:hypothetical protein
MKNNLNFKLSPKFLITLLQLFIVIIVYYYIFTTLIPHEIFLDSIDYVGLQIQQYIVEQAAYQQDLINDLTESFSLEDIEEMEEDLLCYIEEEDSDIEFVKEPDSDDEPTNSESSNSILPLIIIIVHHKLIIKINKFKTKWNKIITTPIILDKVHRNRNIKSNNLKYIKFISIFVLFTSIMYISLLFYPSLLDNLNLSYLLLNITNFIDYITNNLHSFTQYCRDWFNILNFTDNTSKIITPETKITNDYNDNSETIDNKNIADPKPFYKSKTFVICGIIIVSSTLIYLYLNNSLPFISEHNINTPDLADTLLNIIKRKEDIINTLISENKQLTDEKLRIIESSESRMDMLFSILDN